MASRSWIGFLGGLTVGALLAGGLSYELGRIRPHLVNTPQLGLLQAFSPWIRERGLVLVFSGIDGWSDQDAQVARAYARHGGFVAGIDTPSFLDYLNRTTQDCVYLPGMLEDFSHAQQRQADTAGFEAPVLLGRGIGATLVYIAQIQAPVLAFRAAVGIDPQPQIALKIPLCDHPSAGHDLNAQTVKPEPLSHNVPARFLEDSDATAAVHAFVAAIARQTNDSKSTREVTTQRSLRAAYRAALSELEADSRRTDVADLPLAEVRAAAPAGTSFAVIYSGDGGWRDLDRTLAHILASKGVDVVGVDTLRYYWKRKSPQLAAQDLARIIRYYQSRWHKNSVVLIGYSFGADVLPFLVNRLPPDVRARISLISLIAPARETAFEVEPSGWFGSQSDATNPVEPELHRLTTIPVQCIYGEDEANDSLCTTRSAASNEIVRKPGGHHFDGNYDQLADDVLAAARPHSR
jgi:type IV secretory pathway VirJ component